MVSGGVLYSQVPAFTSEPLKEQIHFKCRRRLEPSSLWIEMARHSKLWPEKGVQVLAKMCSMLRSHWDEFRDVYVDVAPLSTLDTLKCVCGSDKIHRVGEVLDSAVAAWGGA